MVFLKQGTSGNRTTEKFVVGVGEAQEKDYFLQQSKV